jgi:hypothetical protein
MCAYQAVGAEETAFAKAARREALRMKEELNAALKAAAKA